MMWLIEVAGWILKWTDLYSAETRQMMQMDNFPKHTTNARVSQEQRNWIRFNCQVRHFKLKPIEDLFKLLNRKLKTDRPIRKQQVKAATVKAQHGTSRGKTQKTFTLFGRIVWHLTPQLEVVCVRLLCNRQQASASFPSDAKFLNIPPASSSVWSQFLHFFF